MLLTALIYTVIPLLASTLAGGIAAFKLPGARLTSAIQHFAAGVVFAAAIELVPEVLHRSPLDAIIGFALGIAVMFALRWASERVERSAGGRGGIIGSASLIGVTGVDYLVDGIVIGAGFVSGSQTGALLSIAIAIEYLFASISVSASLGKASRWLVVGIPFLLALLTTLGAGLGVAVLGGVSNVILAAVLAGGAVVFMYLVTEELLVRAHEHGETAQGSVLFFVGFLIYLVIEQLLAR